MATVGLRVRNTNGALRGIPNTTGANRTWGEYLLRPARESRDENKITKYGRSPLIKFSDQGSMKLSLGARARQHPYRVSVNSPGRAPVIISNWVYYAFIKSSERWGGFG